MKTVLFVNACMRGEESRTLALCRLPEKPAPTEAPTARGCFCPSCGAQVEDYYIFCSECGARL